MFFGVTAQRKEEIGGKNKANIFGVIAGHAAGSVEDVHAFLSKPSNHKALNYLKDGLKPDEVAKLTGLHPNTITKIRKLGLVR